MMIIFVDSEDVRRNRGRPRPTAIQLKICGRIHVEHDQLIGEPARLKKERKKTGARKLVKKFYEHI